MTASLPERCDVAIVGAGPAGLAAASVTAAAGLSTLVFDENPAAGGQIYRNVAAAPESRARLLGDDYGAGRALIHEARRAGARLLSGATVWSLDAGLELGVTVDGRAQTVQAGRVILATGAIERPFPIPGWTLPGVMTAGAAQTLFKSSGLVPEGRVVLAGLGPLLWLLAAQWLRAGVRIEAILETQPASNYLAALPHLPGALGSPLLRKGLSLIREVAGKTRIVRRVAALWAEGEGQVRRVGWSAGGRQGAIDIDLLILHQGVVPNLNLALSAGVRANWHERQACFVPEADDRGRTNIEGILLAGDGAGIAGAEVAGARGRLAGLAATKALALKARLPDEGALSRDLARHLRPRAFIDALYRPPAAFRLPADDSIVCRCEEVTGGQIRAAARLGCIGPNQLKAFTRAGMGPCQGRMCGLTVVETLADALGKSPAEIGYMRLRPPVKPVTLGELAGLPASAEARHAVEGD